MTRAAVRLQEGSLYLLLLLLPFSKAAVEITFVFLLAGWLIERLAPSTRRNTIWLQRPVRSVGLALIAYLLACALSIVVSSHRGLSLHAFFCKWLEYLLFFVIAADLMGRPLAHPRAHSPAAKYAWAVLAVSAFAVVIEAATQEWFGRGLFRGRPMGPAFNFVRMIGPYENPIDLATYLMVVTPILLAYAKRSRGAPRVALWGVLAAVIACLIRTQARSAWIGCALGLLVMMFLDASMRRYGLIALASLVIAGGVLYTHERGVLKALMPSEIGMSDRRVMWQAAIDMIQDRPVLGHGLNTFMANYLDYWVGGERQPRYAHNCYLQVAAETGLVGLACFLWLLGVLYAQLLRSPPGAASSTVLWGLLGGLLAFCVQAALDTNFYSLRQAALFWVLAGLALGLSVRQYDA